VAKHEGLHRVSRSLLSNLFCTKFYLINAIIHHFGGSAGIGTGQRKVRDRKGPIFFRSEHVAKDGKRMSERDNVTVVELREKLKARGLPTTGAKSELILKLQGADLTGCWMESVASGGVEDGRDEARESISRESVPREDVQRREIELYKRERELIEYELDLARREILQLRGQLERSPAGEAIETTMFGNGETSRTQPQVNLTTVADLLALTACLIIVIHGKSD